MKKIIVTVSGGVVETVYTNIEEEIELVIADYDNDAVTKELEKEMEGMRLL